MCGRFNLSYTTSDLSAQLPHVLWDFEQIPSFNIAPSHQISVISEMAGEFRGSRMQWGIPITTSENRSVLMSNTRTEGILERDIWNKGTGRICFIPASGFYEWDKVSNERIPYNVQLQESGLFLMLGIFRETSSFLSCSVLTCPAGARLEKIHHRSPVILTTDIDLKIEKSHMGEMDFLKKALDYQSKINLRLTKVSPKINSIKNNTPDCLLEDSTQQIKLL